jgi:cyclic pyranopterin monophosphate synthase
VTQSPLTHIDAAGQARMVDVSGKDVTARSATATGTVLLSAAAVAALRSGDVPKGDALAVARIAGIQGAKRTPDLIPLCHPIGLHSVAVDLEVADHGVLITCTARTADRTGVEMEAFTSSNDIVRYEFFSPKKLIRFQNSITRIGFFNDVVVKQYMIACTATRNKLNIKYVSSFVLSKKSCLSSWFKGS